MRSIAEAVFRLRQEAANLHLFVRTPAVRETPPTPLAKLPDPAGFLEQLRGTRFAAEVERLVGAVLDNRLPILGYAVDTGAAIDWRRDYIHDRTSPPRYFRLIPYLDFNRVGDHKTIWELNRHQHLVLLAQAFRLTGREAYLGRIARDLETWFAANPYGRGINWTSALEVAFRASSWIWVYHLAGDRLAADLQSRLVTGLYQHGCYLEQNLSTFFSPNTHLLGEAVVLHALGVLFPEFPRARTWEKTGGATVARQLERQVENDGSHFERSSYYHVYALDMFLWHYLLAGAPHGFEEKLARMAGYLHELLGPEAVLPLLGDDDGGRFFHPYGARDRFGRATLATCAVLWNRPEWIGDPEDFYDQGLWWMGGRTVAAARSRESDSVFFPDAGVAVMKAGPVHIIADAGSFGAGSGGHSHSDTLSCVVRRGGEEVLTDSGTYTYLAEPRWRDWFRGSAAHNTVRVDGHDQATPAGPFRWLGRPQIEQAAWIGRAESDLLDAVCTWSGIRHRRRLLFLKPDLLVIVDEVSGPPGEHLVEQFWHLGGRDSVRRIALSQPASLEEGGEHGWRSTVYGRKTAAPVLRVAVRAAEPLLLAAAVDLSAVPAPVEIAAVREDADSLVRLSGARRIHIRFGPASGSVPRIDRHEIPTHAETP